MCSKGPGLPSAPTAGEAPARTNENFCVAHGARGVRDRSTIDDSSEERNHEAPTRKTPSGKERKSGEKRGAATAKSEADRG